MQLTPEPIQLKIEQSALDDLTARLRGTRWSPEISNDDWRYGASGKYLAGLVEYWLHGFDWRATDNQ